MRGAVQSIFPAWLDIEQDLEGWIPDDPGVFAVGLQVFIEDRDHPGPADSFDVIVCSPAWILEHFHHPALDAVGSDRGVLTGRNLLLMSRWDYSGFRKALGGLLDSISATN
jgi:hypothetical protein